MVRYIVSGIGQPTTISTIKVLVDAGVPITEVVVLASILYKLNNRTIKAIKGLKEKGLTIYLDLKPPADGLTLDYVNYVKKLLDKYGEVFDYIIEYTDEDVSFREIVEESGIEYYVHYQKRGDIDYALQAHKRLAIKVSKDIDAVSLTREAKSKGIIDVIWLGYGKFNERINADAISFSTWVNGSRQGVVYIRDKGRIKSIHLKELNSSYWKRIVDEYKDVIMKAGYSYEKILDQSKLGWQHNVFNLISIFTEKEPKERPIKQAITTGFGCINCIMADKCPKYDSSYIGCRLLDDRMNALEDGDDAMLTIIESIIKEKYLRYLRGRIFEDLDGGALDKHVSTLEDSLTRLIETFLKLKYPQKYSGGIVEDDETKAMKKELERILGVST